MNVRRLEFERSAAQAVHVEFFHRTIVPGSLRSVTLSIPHYYVVDAVKRMQVFFRESAANVVDLEVRWVRPIQIWPVDRTQPEERAYEKSFMGKWCCI